MFKVSEIIQATRGRLAQGRTNTEIQQITTDSRVVKRGQLFVALKGERFDGHDFVKDALDNGAAGVLIEKKRLAEIISLKKLINKPAIVVKNTTVALGQIARFHRQKFEIPLIAVTGSNGKTTTKEMIASLLSSDLDVLKSQDSYNNQIGVPLTLLKLTASCEVAVVEMGMNHPREVAYLADIALPNIAVLTNIGFAHLEFFKSIANIARAKCELLQALPKRSVAIVNADDANLMHEAKKYRVKLVTFGIDNNCAYRASGIRMENGILKFTLNKKHEFELQMLGACNVYNALAAIATGDTLGVDFEDMQKKLVAFRLSKLRMQVIKTGGIEFIVDCYNANPSSMEAAVSALLSVRGKKRKILVCGDMLELGKYSRKHHKSVGSLIGRSCMDRLVTVGRYGPDVAYAARDAGMDRESIYSCKDCNAAIRILKKELKPGDEVLFKGSRRMRLEIICERLVNFYKQKA
ncbi:MAG: UDP-N-acetylmuramoyl-tripeptide--D-alanyl-D-alanine ligase [Candidatus Omnitrophota bacterium]